MQVWVEGWRVGGVEGWKGWRVGGLEGWRGGRGGGLEGRKVLTSWILRASDCVAPPKMKTIIRRLVTTAVEPADAASFAC